MAAMAASIRAYPDKTTHFPVGPPNHHRRRRTATGTAAPPTRTERRRVFVLCAADTDGSPEQSEQEKQVPSWARPGSDEPPPWARGVSAAADTPEVPYYAYLLASAVTAIAAVGSMFEYANRRAVFGLVSADSAFYAPLLGFFVFTGIPTSAFLWYKSVQAANKEAEEQDRRDGFL